MKTHSLFFILWILLFAGSCEKESSQLTQDQAIEQVAKSHIVFGRTPGIALGVIKEGQKTVYSWGTSDLSTGKPIDEYTVFEIGSITKLFTGILYAQLAEEGRLSLSDTANSFMPSDRVDGPVID